MTQSGNSRKMACTDNEMCCGCIPVRVSVILIAIQGVISGIYLLMEKHILHVSYTFANHPEAFGQEQYKIGMFEMFCGLLIVTSGLLLYGATLPNELLILPWVFTVTIFVVIQMLAYMPPDDQDLSHQQIFKDSVNLNPYIFGILVIYLIIVITSYRYLSKLRRNYYGKDRELEKF